jgi:FAD/FMN-containing dehydrogenase
MDETKASLTEIVGEAGVLEDPGLGEPFSLAHDLILPVKPRFKVQPNNAEEVQGIVAWANKTLTPLVPMSSGGPHMRGGTTPAVPDSIIVYLSRMGRILRIDRRNRLVLIEPGVTYGQLQPELEKHGLRIVTPLLPQASKSVLASLLEREPVISPRYQWNLVEPLRSLEIIWGNGEKFWSGTGFLRSEKEEDWRKGVVPVVGPGPGQTDFNRFVSAAQGSMGIVTWASVKCEVLPALRKLYLVPADRLEDLIEFTYKLLRVRFGDELFIVNGACLAAILADDPAEIEPLKATLPAWVVVVGITGGQILPRERLEAQQRDIGDIAQQSGLQMLPAVPGCQGDDLLVRVLRPSSEPYWKLRSRGGAQELFFLTTLDKTPGHVGTMFSLAIEHRFPTSELGAYLQPVHQGAGCHCEFILPFDRSSQAEILRAQGLFRAASRILWRQEAFFSRPYGIWADMVYNADSMTTQVTRKIKAIFDPNNVMNPGKLCF